MLDAQLIANITDIFHLEKGLFHRIEGIKYDRDRMRRPHRLSPTHQSELKVLFNQFMSNRTGDSPFSALPSKTDAPSTHELLHVDPSRPNSATGRLHGKSPDKAPEINTR